MRLINLDTLTMRDFIGDDVPPYAILSHTWENDEVTFKQFVHDGVDLQHMSGYQKIKNCALIAREHGYSYLWVDTCCIDKTSSAELSEAINSMYRWYQQAATCIVYLADLGPSTKVPFNVRLGRCRWFTRGWTLQELIAPSEVVFYDSEWQPMGSKAGLYLELTLITRIPALVLSDGLSDDICIAQKFSWASGRQTTRPEDVAYCLLGLFDVNMPLLYGEGEKAFLRLQEEIIKHSDDQSIFAWRDADAHPALCSGLLARHPGLFRGLHDLEYHENRRTLFCEEETLPDSVQDFGITNAGIKIVLELLPIRELVPTATGSVAELLLLRHQDTYLAFPRFFNFRSMLFPVLVLKCLDKVKRQYARIALGQTVFHGFEHVGSTVQTASIGVQELISTGAKPICCYLVGITQR